VRHRTQALLVMLSAALWHRRADFEYRWHTSTINRVVPEALRCIAIFTRR
jgi:hypothetical protein